MEVLDNGHSYLLRNLDVSEGFRPEQPLVFVKREGEGYPGNVGSHPGTTTQEVLRALIERAIYVDNQIPDAANIAVIQSFRNAIWFLEERAARRHSREWRVPFGTNDIEKLPTCDECGHIIFEVEHGH